jgi:PAS domain S-box-containing protein
MTLRRKLLVAQAPLAAALVAVGGAALFTLSALGESARIILADNYRSVLAAQRMKEAIERIDSAALYLIARRPDKADELIPANLQTFEAELGVQERNITEAGENEATARLRALWGAYREKLARYREESTQPERARVAYFAEVEPAFYAVKEAADAILAMNQDAMVRKSETTRRAAERMESVIVVAAFGALALGLFASGVLTRRLLRPLEVLTQTARQLGEGDLGARAVVHGKDEIALLAAEFNEMAARLARYRQSTLGELLQAQRASQAAIDSLADPVIIFDIQGKILSANRAAELLLGRAAESASDDPLREVEPTLRAALERVRAHVLSGKGGFVPAGYEDAVQVVSPDGARHLLPRAAPVYSDEGTVAGATIVLQDVTRLRRFDELKNDLVATVAHEFRTPLTSLRMAIHLCVEQAVGPLTEKQADLLCAARDDCERLQTTVDDLLDLARIQAGKLELRRVDLSSLLESGVRPHQAAAKERGLDLLLRKPVDQAELLVDPDRLQIVLANLLTNAIRLTPGGGRIEIRGIVADQVRIEVADTGPGIPAEYRGKVFQRFLRVPGPEAGGAGLGLSICKEIVGAHGGEIGFQTEEGRGTTFWFTLPRAPD